MKTNKISISQLAAISIGKSTSYSVNRVDRNLAIWREAILARIYLSRARGARRVAITEKSFAFQRYDAINGTNDGWYSRVRLAETGKKLLCAHRGTRERGKANTGSFKVARPLRTDGGSGVARERLKFEARMRISGIILEIV